MKSICTKGKEQSKIPKTISCVLSFKSVINEPYLLNLGDKKLIRFLMWLTHSTLGKATCIVILRVVKNGWIRAKSDLTITEQGRTY